MKWSVLVIVVVVCLLGYGEGGALKCIPGTDDPSCKAEDQKGSQCSPGMKWNEECNACWCNDQKEAICTRRECSPSIDLHTDLKQTSKTQNALPNASLSRKTRGSQELTKKCNPGQEFRMDCNKCLCDDKGINFSCTRNDCNAVNNNNNGGSRRRRETTEVVTTNCVADSVFDKDCNVCRCDSDGRSASCTTKQCVRQNEVDVHTESDLGFRCNPGEQFQQECNDCTCSADGKSIFCTLRLCDQDIIPEM